jgi:TatA/E family protein of Tat protein translocase
MFGLGFWEIAIILVVAFLVLGPKKLPDLARSLGRGLRDLRRASEDIRSSIQEPLDEIRKPLEEIRSDLADTVYQVQGQIEREAALEKLPPPSEGDPLELEDKRREVEELYAQAAREDAAGEDAALAPGEAPQAPAEPDASATPERSAESAGTGPLEGQGTPEKPLAG